MGWLDLGASVANILGGLDGGGPGGGAGGGGTDDMVSIFLRQKI